MSRSAAGITAAALALLGCQSARPERGLALEKPSKSAKCSSCASGLTSLRLSQLTLDHQIDDELGTTNPGLVASRLRDAELATRVRSVILRDLVTEYSEIEVEVEDRAATLSGIVETGAEKAAATALARGTPGISEVDNQIMVASRHEPEVYPHHPHIGNWSTYAWQIQTTSDDEIAENIERELYWSSAVDPAEVRVSVDSGKATLHGFVRSRTERIAAVQGAYEGGALAVVDQLSIRWGDR